MIFPLAKKNTERARKLGTKTHLTPLGMFSGDQRSGGAVRGARFGLLNVRVFHPVPYF